MRAVKFGRAIVDEFFFKFANRWSLRNGVNDDISRATQIYLQAMNCPKFFAVTEPGKSILDLLSGTEKRYIIKQADEILKHRLRVLGEPVSFSDEIDWHVDPRSGYQWPPIYHKRLFPVFNVIDNSDCKYPYELSRLHHLVTIGMAFRITGKSHYAEEIRLQTKSWLKNNPYCYGINWTCAMDVAIRACNLILAFQLIRSYQLLTPAFIHDLFTSIYQHGKYIIDNLENKTLKNNHYLANLVGLVYIATLFPSSVEAAKWREFAICELKAEIKIQIYPDGCNFEASTCYHRLALELFFFATFIIVMNHPKFDGKNHREICKAVFGQTYTRSLEKMFETLLYCLKPNGRMPQIGDNDSGRLFDFGKREVLDMRYLLCLGAIFFREPQFKVREFGFCEESLWVFGQEGYEIWESLGENNLRGIRSRKFPDAGWFIVRDNRDYCFISCGTNGQKGIGGHSHNDKLSIELVMDGKDIIVDPGTYVYTSDCRERNKFRSTRYHNTIFCDQYEQSALSETNMFLLPEGFTINHVSFTEDSTICSFQGSISYGCVTHTREVDFDKTERTLQIRDYVISTKLVRGKMILHLAPGIDIEGNVLICKKSKKAVAWVDTGNTPLSTYEYDYSPEYGIKVKSTCLLVDMGEITHGTVMVCIKKL